jgi:uncharacterized protein (TIGR03083 family)
MDLTDLNPDELLQVSFDSAELAGDPVPALLPARLFDRAVGARPAQDPRWGPDDGAPTTAIAAFARTASDLGDLLASLSPAEWEAPTDLDGSPRVRDLARHLVGVERYVLGQLGRLDVLDAPRREDHWPVTMAASAELADEPPALAARRWWHDVLLVMAACAELGPEHPVSYHHLAGSLRGLLLVRTFELWVHGDDVRKAIGRPLDLLDENRLTLMSGQLMQVLPLGMGLSGCPRPGRSALVELTGTGGATFTIPLAPGEEAGEPDVRIRVGTIEFCRFASNRLDREALELEIDGDASLLEPMLVGATAFAAD